MTHFAVTCARLDNALHLGILVRFPHSQLQGNSRVKRRQLMFRCYQFKTRIGPNKPELSFAVRCFSREHKKPVARDIPECGRQLPQQRRPEFFHTYHLAVVSSATSLASPSKREPRISFQSFPCCGASRVMQNGLFHAIVTLICRHYSLRLRRCAFASHHFSS